MDWREYIPDLTDEQIKGVAEILRDMGQVALASGVIPFLFPIFIPERAFAMLVGLTAAIMFWSAIIIMLNYIKRP